MTARHVRPLAPPRVAPARPALRVTAHSAPRAVTRPALAAAALAWLALAGCADLGPSAKSGPTVHQLQDAVQHCRQSGQRVRLTGPNAPADQGSYTNIQDSNGQRQTERSDPSGGGSWFRCGP